MSTGCVSSTLFAGTQYIHSSRMCMMGQLQYSPVDFSMDTETMDEYRGKAEARWSA